MIMFDSEIWVKEASDILNINHELMNTAKLLRRAELDGDALGGGGGCSLQ